MSMFWLKNAQTTEFAVTNMETYVHEHTYRYFLPLNKQKQHTNLSYLMLLVNLKTNDKTED